MIPQVQSKHRYDFYAFLGILFVAIVSYGILSKTRGLKTTVLIVLEDSSSDEIQKGAIEAGRDLKIRVVFTTPDMFEDDIDTYNPKSVVAFSNIKPPKGIQVFNGKSVQKQNRPTNAFAEGYLAVVSTKVNFMSEEFEEDLDDKEKEVEKSTASPFRGRF